MGDWPSVPRSWFAWGGGVAADLVWAAVNVEIRGNHAKWAGGGTYGPATHSGSLFTENTAHLGGGAFYDGDWCDATGLLIDNAVIHANVAFDRDSAGEGGGVYGPAFLSNSTVSENVAYGNGGGTFAAHHFKGEVFGNRAIALEPFDTFGGGLYWGGAEETCIHDNVAEGGELSKSYGGGAAEAELSTTQFWRNFAMYGAGASNCALDRCTVFDNVAGVEGGGLYFDGPGKVDSAIVWENFPDQIVDHFGMTVVYTNVQHGWPGTGNTNENPWFWDPAAFDFNLLPTSGCIDKGNPAVEDPDGTRCDMGALPFDDAYCGEPRNYCQARVSSGGCLPSIGYEGAPSLTGPDDFRITALDVPNGVNGLLLWGYGPVSQPFMGGTLCVQVPLARSPMMGSGGSLPPVQDCSGTFSFDLTQTDMAQKALDHGQVICAQYLYRDPGLGDPGQIGMTDGLRAVVCP